MKFSKVSIFCSLLVCFALLFSASSQAQRSQKPLFTIDNQPTYAKEFLKVYQKNLDLIQDERQKDLEQYLELFIDYKLKVEEAQRMGLDQQPTFLNEYKKYRAQLSEGYLVDTAATRRLVREAYEHSKSQVRAAHILLTVNPNASPADTLAQYQLAQELRARALAGEEFANLAKQYSQDPSAPQNGGDLGYFSAFRMVYAFEKAAFSTPVGSISEPIRTRFGYHLVKILDKRTSKGERTVAHIMLLTELKNDSVAAETKKRIFEIYDQLQNGSNFEALARRFSNDKGTAINGGKLPRFAEGGLRAPKFEEAAFALEEVGEISKPVQSRFGWHIIKLLDKHPVASFEEMRVELIDKVKKDKRHALVGKALAHRLKATYSTQTQKESISQVIDSIDTTFFTPRWNRPTHRAFLAQPILTIEDTEIPLERFVQFLNRNRQKADAQEVDLQLLVANQLNEFVDQELLEYYRNDLENQNEDFAAIIQEYRNGLLLFELMEQRVWNKAKEDSVGLADFFTKHQAKYQWKKRAEVTFANCPQRDKAQKVQELWQLGKSNDEIKALLNEGSTVHVLFQTKTLEEGHRSLPSNTVFQEGVSEVLEEENNFVVLNVQNIESPRNKTLEEARGKVISDYQDYLEAQWLQELRNDKNIVINRKLLKRLKKEQLKRGRIAK